MPVKMPLRHHHDDTLLAYLDGELSRLRAHSVYLHLQICWNCRAKLAELEVCAETVSRLLSQPNLLNATGP